MKTGHWLMALGLILLMGHALWNQQRGYSLWDWRTPPEPEFHAGGLVVNETTLGPGGELITPYEWQMANPPDRFFLAMGLIAIAAGGISLAKDKKPL